MEKWKDIPGYEGLYQASDEGRIKSLDRENSIGNKIKGKILKNRDNGKGRLRVELCNKNRKIFQVHRLVLKTFICDCPKGMEAIHFDDNPLNNNLNNLKWGTHSENMRMMHDHGRANLPDQKGENHPQSILKQYQVNRIIFLKGKVQWGFWSKLSRALNVSQASISMIINNNRWNKND